MNFTLKNRPKLDAIPDETQSYVHIVKTLEWFQGFEKQLRKELRDMYRSAETKQLIKEILGDEP